MRRRFIQLPDGTLVDSADYEHPPLRADAGALWGDAHYDGLRATDGTPIDTREKHRAYMRSHGLTTVDDFTEQWQRDRARRDAFYTSAPDPERVRDIARAVEKRRG